MTIILSETQIQTLKFMTNSWIILFLVSKMMEMIMKGDYLSKLLSLIK